MCGRFTHRYTWKDLHRLMRLTTMPPTEELKPSYNVAPTQFSPVVRQDPQGNRSAGPLRWGLVPFWAKDPSIGNRLINARSEDISAKRAFSAAVKKRRCLVPIDGFYEWQAVEGSTRKQPWFITVKGTPVFALAGLWESWGNQESGRLETFTILTGPANELVRPIHDRMPIIVRPEMYDLWLDPTRQDVSQVAGALETFPASAMEAWRIGSRVNSPAHDDPSLTEPAAAVAPRGESGTLFDARSEPASDVLEEPAPPGEPNPSDDRDQS